jgi:hypothetical protein
MIAGLPRAYTVTAFGKDALVITLIQGN